METARRGGEPGNQCTNDECVKYYGRSFIDEAETNHDRDFQLGYDHAVILARQK